MFNVGMKDGFITKASMLMLSHHKIDFDEEAKPTSESNCLIQIIFGVA